MSVRGNLCLALLACAAMFAEDVGAAEAPYVDPWDEVTQKAAESAVARLGAKRGLAIERRVLEIRGLTAGVTGGGTGLVATVAEVKQALRDLGGRETGLEVEVDLPADVLFDFDKADIRPDAAAALAKLAILIRAHPGGATRLEGHTDAVGNDAHNQALSERRAQAVQRWLVEREGIAAAALTVRGFGESQPVASNDTDQGRQKNRRVRAVIRKGPP